MSAPVESPAAASSLASASAAASRVAELRQMIQEVETGSAGSSGSFQQQLSAATEAGGKGPAVANAVVTGSSGASASTTAPTTGATGGSLNPAVPFAAQIEAAAARNGIDPTLLAGLIKAESNFDPTVGSGAGAQGLTELMPGTAASVGVKDPHDPTESIEGGARVLREMLDKFGGNTELALAAYNAGPGAVEQYNGIPPYPETQAYVPRVLGFAAEFRQGATR